MADKDAPLVETAALETMAPADLLEHAVAQASAHAELQAARHEDARHAEAKRQDTHRRLKLRMLNAIETARARAHTRNTWTRASERDAYHLALNDVRAAVAAMYLDEQLAPEEDAMIAAALNAIAGA
jgi:hypothetical protein